MALANTHYISATEFPACQFECNDRFEISSEEFSISHVIKSLYFLFPFSVKVRTVIPCANSIQKFTEQFLLLLRSQMDIANCVGLFGGKILPV